MGKVRGGKGYVWSHTEVTTILCSTHALEVLVIILVPLFFEFLPHLFDRLPKMGHETDTIVWSAVLLFPQALGFLFL
jgi:hypothetical protein